jgi:hypothetical protein
MRDADAVTYANRIDRVIPVAPNRAPIFFG